MIINILYFTSTGNTLWLLQRAKQLFEEKGNNIVNTFDAVTCGSEFADNCDMIGVFYPVWGSDMPDQVRDHLNQLKEASGKKIFLVGNCAVFTGDTGIHWKKILEKKGYDVFYVGHLTMPININIPGWNLWKVPDKEKHAKILAAASSYLKETCSSVLEGKRKVDGTSPFSRFFGWFQRLFLQAFTDYARKFFMCDSEKCVRCGLCYRMCPVKNITIDEDKGAVFGPDCIICMKCYNLCPVNAVLVDKGSRDDKRYRRYKGPAPDIKPVEYR
ncbi:EFR1 family ferrodoxin [Candidatus Omnitrophota bacterium]